MIVIYPSHHMRHVPPNEIFNGNRDPHAEVPERIGRIKQSVSLIPSVRVQTPKRFPISAIEAVHDSAYVQHIRETSRSAGKNYVYPSVFPYGEQQRTGALIGLRGQYGFDLYTPVGRTTYDAACESAFAALTAASIVEQGERVSYALCRPPGHHAEISKMGGYCYFNNAAAAAHFLSRRGRVAVLDIDVHHGNGTQGIFYSRRDVLVVNIHATPDAKFPYFTGYANERGVGRGRGYNFNFPLPVGTHDATYDRTLTLALRRVQTFGPAYLVASIGYDAHEADPIGGFELTTPYYSRMAARISALGIPTILVQEGGYNTAKLGDVARTFVEGFLRS